MEDIINTIVDMQREMERTFRELWTKLSAEKPLEVAGWEPPTDIVETDEEIIVYVDVPGFSRDDIRVKVTEDSVEVRAERSAERRVEGKYLLRQRIHKSLFKLIKLPVKIRPEEAKAKLENGVLVIYLPKRTVGREVPISIE